MNKITKILAFILLAILMAILAMVVTYQVAIKISPPYIIDEQTGEKYGVMPMGQLFLSVLIAFVIFVIALVFFYVKFIRTKK